MDISSAICYRELLRQTKPKLCENLTSVIALQEMWSSCATNIAFSPSSPTYPLGLSKTTSGGGGVCGPPDGMRSGLKRNFEAMIGENSKYSSKDFKEIQAREHIIAERKRREKLSQQFISLSAIVPGLKKLDKASVLEEAVKYIKGLQERMKILKEQKAMRTVECVVLVNRSRYSELELGKNDDDDEEEDSSSETNEEGNLIEQQLVEIEVRVVENIVLMKIHCEDKKGTLVKVMDEIEKLHMSINSFSSMPFTTASLHIIVTAQFEENFSMTAKKIAKTMKCAFRR